MLTDRELLRQYADQGDQAAFREIVRQHADLVYSVVLRVTVDRQFAEDVTQKVFLKLAREAKKLCAYDTLVGWLHVTARHAAIDAIRSEERRRAREQEVFIMQPNSSTTEVNWEQLQPLLDEAVEALPEDDRKAVLLRFFKNQSHQEIGAVLGLSEDTARKRGERALEKLRLHFAGRGVTMSAALLGSAISANSVQAAPAGLWEKIMPVSLADATGGSGAGKFLFWLMNNKTKTILAAAILLALVTVPAWRWSTASEVSPVPAPTSMPAPAKPAPLPVASPPPRVEPPVARVAPPVAPAAAAEPQTLEQPANPRLRLDTAMSDFVDLLDAGEYAQAADAYLQLPANTTGAELINTMSQNPDFPNTVRMLRESTRAAQTGTPEYNGTGDVVTYKLNSPVEGKTLVRWKKINDQWFVDGYE